MSGPRTLLVSVRFDKPIPGGGAVHVILEDTSRADAAAKLVAKQTEALTRALAAGERVTFRLTVPHLDNRARYDVRAHVDHNGSGDISPGDRITTRAYPVLTHGAPDEVELHVVEI